MIQSDRHTVHHHFLKLLDEHLLTDARHHPAKLAESLRTAGQVTLDGKFPFAPGVRVNNLVADDGLTQV